MNHRLLIGNLLSGLAGEGLGETIGAFCTACSKGDKVAIAAVLGGLTGGPLLAVGLLAGGVGLQMWGQSREAKKQREQYEELSARITSCKGDTRQIIELLVPIAERSKVLEAGPPSDQGAEPAEWVANQVRKTLAPLLPEGADTINWKTLRIYVESNRALLDDLLALQREHMAVSQEALDILKTGRARSATIPEGVSNNLALAGVRMNADFVGRRALIERAHAALVESTTAALAHALSAEGGVGKTEIAIAYVYDQEYAQQWHGIWWLDASAGALDASLAVTLDGMGYQRRKGDDTEALRREFVRRLGDKKHLVVLDNVDEQATLENFAVGTNTRILATTRLAPQAIPPSLARAIAVDVLDDAEAAALLLQHRPDLYDAQAGKVAAQHAGAVDKIIEDLDGHALAVALCAAALRLDEGLLPAALLEQLRANEVEAKGHALEHVEADATGRKYGLKVAASLLLLLPGVEAQHPLAPKLLLAASLLHPSKIPFSLLVAATRADEAEARRAILALRDRSIVRFDARAGVEGKGLVSVHRLTQSAVRESADLDPIFACTTVIVSILDCQLEDSLDPTYWPIQSEILNHAIVVLNYVKPGSLMTAHLLNNIGIFLKVQGHPAEAEAALEDSLAMLTTLVDGDHPNIVACLSNLASIHLAHGNIAQLESRVSDAVAMSHRLYDSDHTVVAHMLNQLGVVHMALGQPNEAQAPLSEALDMRRRLHEGDHIEVKESLTNLAGAHLELGDIAAAEALTVEALAMSRRLYSGDHPLVAKSIHYLASLYQIIDRDSEAETLQIEALSMLRRLFNGDHPDTALSLRQLGVVQMKLQKPRKAQALLDESLEMYRRLFNGNHPDLAIVLRDLAQMRLSQNRNAEAVNLLEQAAAMYRRLYKNGHPHLADTLTKLASVHQALDQVPQAESLVEEALTIRRRLFSGDHATVANGLNNLGVVRMKLGRWNDAEPLLTEALAMRRRLLNGDVPELAMSLNNLAMNRTKQDRWVEALPLSQEAVDMGRRCLPSGHAWRKRWETNLKTILKHLGGR